MIPNMFNRMSIAANGDKTGERGAHRELERISGDSQAPQIVAAWNIALLDAMIKRPARK